MSPIIVIGAGHNGLVAAFTLAKAGRRVLVLESRDAVGGAAITTEFHPGFRVSTLAHAAAGIPASIATPMRLAERGVRFITPDVAACVLVEGGRPLVVPRDDGAAAAALSAFSTRDAERYGAFRQSLQQLGGVFASLFDTSPPAIDRPGPADWWNLARLGRQVRGLGRADTYRLLRWVPMPVADLAAEWFETESLRALVAGRGIFGGLVGPRSAGSSLALLLGAGSGDPLAPTFVEGGLGALTLAMAAAATDAGVQVRTGAPVSRVLIESGRAVGVALVSGEEIRASAVVSGADPKRTLLQLVDPAELGPELVWRTRNIRARGVTAKVNLALSRLPAFEGVAEADARALSGRIQIGASIDYLERAFDAAKYGGLSMAPFLDIAIPTLTDPGLAPAGQHVMSVNFQYAPFTLRNTDWAREREALLQISLDAIGRHSPHIHRHVIGAQVLTPADLEAQFGLTGGHIYHGDLTLDQFFAARPLIECARYRTPIPGLYLCSAGTHPGFGVNGRSGAHAARAMLADGAGSA